MELFTAENQERVAFVAGASRGIGAKVATKLTMDGWGVAGTHRGSGVPEGVYPILCDVNDAISIDEAFTLTESKLGPVSAVVCNAGITEDNLAVTMKEDQFTNVIDTNLCGAYRVVHRALPKMLSQRYGRIILMGSSSGLQGVSGQINYTASKAGLVGMARSLCREYASRGITTNVIAPGYVNTDMTEKLPDSVRKTILAEIPAKSFADPQEIAAVTSFLLSDSARYINGAIIPVDGGLSMGH